MTGEGSSGIVVVTGDGSTGGRTRGAMRGGRERSAVVVRGGTGRSGVDLVVVKGGMGRSGVASRGTEEGMGRVGVTSRGGGICIDCCIGGKYMTRKGGKGRKNCTGNMIHQDTNLNNKWNLSHER
jgi:hypothetical protein